MAVKDNKNGTCTIDYRDQYGNRHRKIIKGSKTAAKEIISKIKSEIAEGKYFPDRQKQKITFGEIAKQYWKLHGSITKSAPKMIYNFNILMKHFANKKISAITPCVFQDFYNKKALETSSSTANRYFTLMRAIINFGLKNKLYVGENLCSSISKLPENPSRTRYLTVPEIKAFLANSPEHMRPFFAFALMTGMRRGEILNLTWRDIDFTSRFIHVHETKSNKSREVPMLDGVLNILSNPSPNLNDKIFNFTIAQIRYAFKKTLKLSKITNFRFHDSRHTYASQYIINGGDINILQKILGHASVRMTNRYAHLSKNFLINSIKNLEKIMPKDITFENTNLLPYSLQPNAS